MATQWKVWVEIERIPEKGEPQEGADFGILPDCVGSFEGKGAKEAAIKRQAQVAQAYGIDPENSDAVKETT